MSAVGCAFTPHNAVWGPHLLGWFRFIGGASMMILMHGLVVWKLSLPAPNAAIAVTGILGFIGFFAISSGAVIWVYISEVFPNAVRAKG